MRASVVIGSAYGDEGKGLFTDYLSSGHEKSLVVRFNGGAQAGHTVTTPEGIRHVFGHFGSNSLLGHETYLSEFFVINPFVFKREWGELKRKGFSPKVYAHKDCFVTLPYDMILNQLVEQKRDKDRHGSCGMGFGETIERNEKKEYRLTLGDMKSDFSNQIKYIRNNYLPIRAEQLGVADMLSKRDFILSNDLIDKFTEDMKEIMEHIEVVDSIPEHKNIVFEGAQGLLLDQKLGYFPFVTRSNTGLKNVISLIEKTEIKALEVVYATRCYTTRHGAGPLSNPLKDKPYENIVDNTNVTNEFQGTLRFAYLDIDLLKDTIARDIENAQVPPDIFLTIKIGLSCVDQTENVSFYKDKILFTLPIEDFIINMKKEFGYPMLISRGPTRKTISEI